MEKVNHPNHYNTDGEKDESGSSEFEAIKVIEDWGFGIGFCFGNALKYICRAEHKGSKLRDLKSAKWYLDRADKALFELDFELVSTYDLKCKIFPMRVSKAWKLSARLQRAVELIYQGEPLLASNEVQKYIAEIEVKIEEIERNG